MALEDILVHIDNGPRCSIRLNAALGLAVKYGAHLTGLYVITRPHIPGYVRAEIPDDLLQRQARAIDQAAADAETMFGEYARRAGVNSEWRCVEGVASSVVGLHGRYADIVIVGQRDPSGEAGAYDRTMPDDVILDVGRPVLVIPHGGEFPVIGERILVAWNASRPATRAVIVCGAYGHARWREIVLGGVTRHLLEHMTVPVLMSH
jgi:nucleotide-binding universal stress UspA family protein